MRVPKRLYQVATIHSPDTPALPHCGPAPWPPLVCASGLALVTTLILEGGGEIKGDPEDELGLLVVRG